MPYAELLVAIGFLSLPAVLVRFAEASVEALGFWRTLLAAAALSPLAWRGRAEWRRLPTGKRALVALAGFFFFIHLWLYTYAARHTRVASCMLAFSVHPLLTALGARLVFSERLGPRLMPAFALAALGVWTVASGSASLGAANARGDLAALASAAAFSAYVLAGRQARRSLGNAVFSTLVCCVAAGFFLASGLARGAVWTGYSARGWAAVAGLGFGVTVLGHSLYTRLYAELDVHVLGLAKLLEPPLGACLAYAALGEPLSPRALAGFALVAGALAVSVSNGAYGKR